MTRTRSGFLPLLVGLALVGAAGCDTKVAAPTSGSNPYHMTVFTPEGDATLHLLSVGDTGFAELYVDKSCVYVCWPEAAYGEFRSSDTNVVTLQYIDSTGTGAAVRGHAVRIFGRAPGSAHVSYIFASSPERWADSMRVGVVAAPLPVDSVRVRLRHASGGSAVTDAAGNVVSATLSAGAGLDFRTVAFRGGDSTVYLLGTVGSSDTAVAQASVRSWFLWDDSWRLPCCRVGISPWESQNASVSAVFRGSATVTVSARNRGYSFLVTVQ